MPIERKVNFAIQVKDENGTPVPAEIDVIATDGSFYIPSSAFTFENGFNTHSKTFTKENITPGTFDVAEVFLKLVDLGCESTLRTRTTIDKIAGPTAPGGVSQVGRSWDARTQNGNNRSSFILRESYLSQCFGIQQIRCGTPNARSG